MTNAQVSSNESDVAPTPELNPTGPSSLGMAPGSLAAAKQGCRCSVLANATFRAGVPGVEPLIDPTCTVHLVVPVPTAEGLAASTVVAEPVFAPVSVSGAHGPAVTAPIPAIRSTTPWADPAAA